MKKVLEGESAGRCLEERMRERREAAECRGAGGGCRDGRRGKSGREKRYGPRRGRWQRSLGRRSFCLVV